MDVSFTKLRHLAAVAECGSLSRAAGELNLSQPALSRSIASIEARYGLRIFDRSRTGVALTSSGRQIMREVDRLLRGSRMLDHNLRLHGRGEAGDIAVGIGPLVSSILLADLARHIFTERQMVRLRTLVRPTEVLVQALLNDEIDLMIAPGPFEFPVEVETQSLGGCLSASFIVRPSHPLARAEHLDLEDVLQYPLACSVEISWAQREGLTSRAFVCDNFHIIGEVVPHTDLVWVCPQHYVADQVADGALAVLEVANSPLTNGDSPFAINEVFMGHLTDRTLSPLALEVLHFCKAFFAKHPRIV